MWKCVCAVRRAARVTATLHAPVSGADGGTLYGPPLGGISLTGQRVQESGEYLLSTEKSGPKLEPGELLLLRGDRRSQGDDEDAQFHRGGFRTLTTHATAGTAIAGTATSPIAAAAGSPVNPLPVAERVKPQPTDAIQGEGAGARTDAKVDCVNNPPRIAHVRGAITPGGQFTIAGMCFGTAPGRVEIDGQFAGGTLKPDSQWSDSNVVVQMPATPPIATLASHKVAVSVIRAPDGRKSAALAADFRVSHYAYACRTTSGRRLRASKETEVVRSAAPHSAPLPSVHRRWPKDLQPEAFRVDDQSRLPARHSRRTRNNRSHRLDRRLARPGPSPGRSDGHLGLAGAKATEQPLRHHGGDN